MAEVTLLNAATTDSETASAEAFAGGEFTVRVQLANSQGTERVYIGSKPTGSSINYTYTAVPRRNYTEGQNFQLMGATDVVAKVDGIQAGNSTTVTVSMNS